jgi:hypothetical protein
MEPRISTRSPLKRNVGSETTVIRGMSVTRTDHFGHRARLSRALCSGWDRRHWLSLVDKGDRCRPLRCLAVRYCGI